MLRCPTYVAAGTTTARCSVAVLRAPLQPIPATPLYSLAVLPRAPTTLARAQQTNEKHADKSLEKHFDKHPEKAVDAAAASKAHSDCASEHVKQGRSS